MRGVDPTCVSPKCAVKHLDQTSRLSTTLELRIVRQTWMTLVRHVDWGFS
jgi:hypothetical protein